MEKEAPGGENSQIAAALAAGSDRASFCKKLPGAGDPNSDALQTRVAPNITITSIKILGEYIVKNETRFSVLAKSRKLVRTRSATLPPFHLDEGPCQIVVCFRIARLQARLRKFRLRGADVASLQPPPPMLVVSFVSDTRRFSISKSYLPICSLP